MKTLDYCTMLVLFILAENGRGDSLDDWTLRYQFAPPASLGQLAYGNGQFLAVGSWYNYSTLGWENVFETSSDGINWEVHLSGAQTRDSFNYLDGVIFAQGQFVAVAGGGTIYASTTGTNWIPRPTAASNLFGIGYGNGTFVAVGEGGTILSSSDAVNWASQRSGTTNELGGVAYGNGQFVVIGDDGTTLTSTEGANWVRRPSGPWSIGGIAYGKGQFVVADYYGRLIASSTDGATWKWTWTWNPSEANNFESVAYGNGEFVVGGGGAWRGRILTSTNGLDWVTHLSAVPDAANTLYRMAYGNGQFVALGYDPYGTSANAAISILSSTNGVNWVVRQPAQPSELGAVIYANGQFVAVGDAGAILSSTNGADWVPRQSGTSAALSSPAYGNGQFVALGATGPILTSSNATDWIQHPPAASSRPARIAFGNGQFVGVGPSLTNSSSGVATSTDGVNWVPRQSGSRYALLGAITYGNGRFVAAGTSDSSGQGVIMTSTNGVDWSSCQSDTTNSLFDIAYGNGIFVAVGGSGFRIFDVGYMPFVGVILTSADGVNWVERLVVAGDKFAGVAYGNGQFLVNGLNHLWSSAGGINWVQRQWVPVGVSAFAYGNGRFVTVGGPTIWQSGQILTLALTPNPATGLLSLSLTGQSGLPCTIQSSTDLSIWQTLTNLTLLQSSQVIFDALPGAPDQMFYRTMPQLGAHQ